MRQGANLKLRIVKPDLQTRLLFMWLCEIFALTVARFILSKLGIYEGTTRTLVLWFIASIPLVLFLLYARGMNSKRYTAFLVLFVFVFVSTGISYLANPALGEYFTRSGYGLDRILRPDCALYAFLFFSMFDDPVKLRKNLTVFAYLDFVYLVIVQLLPALSRGYWVDIGAKGQDIHLAYSLSFGYSILLPIVIFLYLSFKDRKVQHIFFALAGLWCVVTQGNRGALLIPVIFVGMMVISSIIGSENVSKKALKITGILLAILVFGIFGDNLLNLGLSLLQNSGISSRNIEMLLQGTISNDNGRELIWVTVINAIRNGGIFGHGVLGDRPFVSSIHYVGYSHNIFLELICSFGIIGAIVSIYIIADAIRMIFFCKDTEWRELYIILFSVSCQLLLSMSFWYVWEFWAAAAVAYRYRKISGLKITRRKNEK